MIHPIYVPSKARPNNCSFISACAYSGHIINVVVEPQDYEAYKERYPHHNYIILPENNRGIAFVRNFIKMHAGSMAHEWYWMIDDDVTNFYRRENKKMVKSTMGEALGAVQRMVDEQPNIGQAALEYQQLAWSAEKDFKLNGYCDVCVLINSDRTREIAYRDYVSMKEDRDFTMQIIKSGADTLRCTTFGFAAPKNGSNAGGLKEIAYDVAGRERVAVDRMVELWGEDVCVPFVKPDGRQDVKIRWKNIRSAQTSLF